MEYQKTMAMAASAVKESMVATGANRTSLCPLHPMKRGDAIEVFYRSNQDGGDGYFPVATASAGTLRPRLGRTDGWMPAVVEEDWPPTGQQAPGRIRIRHTHPYWSNRRGERLDMYCDRDMVTGMLLCDVRLPPAAGTKPAELPLSIFVVRWGGEQTQFNREQWGAASASVSDDYVEAVLDGTVYRRLGPNYEVYTAWVESGADLAKLQPAAVVSNFVGRHHAGCYFLWPIAAQDGGDIDQSGMVRENDYFAAVRGFEAAGLPTRFPHASQLYQTLLAKDWQPTLCLLPRLRIPPATTVNRASIARDPHRAAAATMEALAAIRELRYGADGEPACLAPVEGEIRRGVVKLGFAWEAAYVRIFRGPSQLAEALAGLCATPGGEGTALIVQDFCKNDFEMRCFVVNGRVSHVIYSSFERIDVDGYCRDFVKKDRREATRDWMAGDEPSMDDAERKAARLVSNWLTWLRCKNAEATPCVRMDILVRRAGPGKAEVHTLELTEMGFSLLAWPEGPDTVFNALLDSMFTDRDMTAADEEDLGPSVVHVGGHKSGREYHGDAPPAFGVVMGTAAEQPRSKKQKKHKHREGKGKGDGKAERPSAGESGAEAGFGQ